MSHDDKRRFSRVRVLIFDLDGTLIDSKLDLAHSVNAMLEHMGRASLPHETILELRGKRRAAAGATRAG